MSGIWLPDSSNAATALRNPARLSPYGQPRGQLPKLRTDKLIDVTKIAACVLPGLYGGKNFGPTGGVFPANTALTMAGGPLGIGVKWKNDNQNQSYVIASNSNNILDNTSCTMLFATVRTGTDGTSGANHGYEGGTTTRVFVFMPYITTLVWDYGNETTGRLTVSIANYLSIGTINIWAVVAGSRGREIWRNGVLLASNASKTATRPDNSYPFYLGASYHANGYTGKAPKDITSLFVLSREQWSQDACALLTRRPYDIFSSSYGNVFVDAGAASFPFSLGSTQIQSASIGSAPITAIYKGSTKLWP